MAQLIHIVRSTGSNFSLVQMRWCRWDRPWLRMFPPSAHRGTVRTGADCTVGESQVAVTPLVFELTLLVLLDIILGMVQMQWCWLRMSPSVVGAHCPVHMRRVRICERCTCGLSRRSHPPVAPADFIVFVLDDLLFEASTVRIELCPS